MQAVLTRFCARRAYNFPDVCVLLASNSKQALTSMGFRTAAFRLCRFSSAVHAPSSIERHIGWLVSTSIAQAFSFVKQKTTFCRLCRFCVPYLRTLHPEVVGSSPGSAASSEIPTTVPFPASPKTALWWEFLRFPPRLASLDSRRKGNGGIRGRKIDFVRLLHKRPEIVWFRDAPLFPSK